MHDAATANLIAHAIDHIGRPSFPASIAALCEAVSGHSTSFLAGYFKDHPPVELFDNLTEDQSDSTLTPYLDFAYLLDPFYDLFLSGREDSVVPLSVCAPDAFRQSNYYQLFYAQTGLRDETAIFIRFSESAALILSLGTREADVSVDDTALERLLPVITALCRRHWPMLSPDSLAGQGRLGQHLAKSFERFGSSILSGRETQVVRLILKGHSSKSTARVLGISPETIKVHRKRAYAKLGIASQGELFSLFINALTRMPPNAEEDPLCYGLDGAPAKIG